MSYRRDSRGGSAKNNQVMSRTSHLIQNTISFAKEQSAWSMSKDIFTVDAFSEVAFKGNPAAVVLLNADDEISDRVLQAIAEELNLSETAFVRPIAGGDATGEYSLRWFTPTNEVPLCGHATLASAHALFSHPSRGVSLPRILRFDTHSGQLTVERLLDGDLCMVLPLNAPTACSHSTCGPKPYFFAFPFDRHLRLTTHLQHNHLFCRYFLTSSIAAGGYPVLATSVSLSAKKLIVHIDASVHQLRSLSPDVAALHASHDGSLFKGVIVTIAGGKTALSQPSCVCAHI
jgi:hypothetical protein